MNLCKIGRTGLYRPTGVPVRPRAQNHDQVGHAQVRQGGLRLGRQVSLAARLRRYRNSKVLNLWVVTQKVV